MRVYKEDTANSFLLALCHNCDRWHLPHPCDKSLHPCGQCGNTGHMEFFCPVRPIGRMAYIQQQYLLTANGPQPTNHGYRLPLDGAIPHGEQQLTDTRALCNN
jgi:hypothetical protein